MFFQRPIFFVLTAAMLLLVSTVAQSRDAGDRRTMARRELANCGALPLKSLAALSRCITEGKTDSLRERVTIWEKSCGVNWCTMRVRVLLAVKEGTFSESLYTRRIIDDLLYYRDVASPASTPAAAGDQLGEAIDAFNAATRILAREALARADRDSLEYLFARHYSGEMDSTFSAVQEARFAHTALRSYYDTGVRDVQRGSYYYAGVLAGGWIPGFGERRLFERHANFGATAGVTNAEWDISARVVLSENVPRTANPPYMSAQNYFGVSAGFDVGKKLYSAPTLDVMVTGGISINSYAPTPIDNPKDNRALGLVDLAIGLSYGFRPAAYGRPLIGVQGRYHHLATKTSSVEDPPSGGLTFHLLITFPLNDHRIRDLQELSAPAR